MTVEADETVRIGFPGIAGASTPYAVEHGVRHADALEEAAELLGGAMALTRLIVKDDLKDRHELGVMCLHALQTSQALIESVQRSCQ